MSWLFSQALAEEYSEAICSDGEQFAQLNVMPTQHKFWRNDKTMEFSRLSQFGLTSRLLTENHGQELLTSYLAGFRAKTYQQQEKAQVLKENDQECGNTWPGLLAKYDRATHTWKTAQCSLLEDSDEFSETWPRWGMMRNGVSYLRQIPALRIYGNESGLWATPTTMDKLPPKSPEALHREATIARPGRSKPANSRDQVSNMKNWPTPQTRGFTNDGDLMALAKSCETFEEMNGMAYRASLKKKKQHWPTPVSTMSKGSSQASLIRKSGKSRQNDRLDHAVMASNNGQLNPTWVEWLMGWPLGWTDLKPLAMDKCHCVRPLHGDCLQTFDCWQKHFKRQLET